jgi:putative iron-dependent peroxidase
MATGQPGIFAQGTRAHYHLELDLRPDAELEAVIDALRRLGEPHVTAGGLNLVVGFGAGLWAGLAPDGQVPVGLRPFAPIAGTPHAVPATQHDVWVWLHGTGPDLLLDGARAVAAIFAPVATLAAECPGFVYQDSRDLTGFVDGTENPPVATAPETALVPQGSAGEGGSFVVAMRWVHDLAAFDALAVAEQEGVIGRTKPDSVELDDAVKPRTAHIARVVIEEGGEELEIYRRSVPYGTVGEHGLFFVAFSAEVSRFDKMLGRMFGTAGDGLHDRLTDFTRPVSAAYDVAPALETFAAVVGR